MNVLNYINNETTTVNSIELPFNESYELFKNKLNVYVNTDKDYDNCYLLKTDEEKSNLENKAVRDCQGLILEKDTNKILCYPHSRCYRFEDFKYDGNWDNVIINHLNDGTRIHVWWNETYKQWIVSTGGCINAKKANWAHPKTFWESFTEVLNKYPNSSLYSTIIKNEDKMIKSMTYMFMLCTKEQKNIIEYKDNKLIHTGSRCNVTGNYINYDLGIPKPELVSKEDFDMVRSIMEGSDPDRLNTNNFGYIITLEDNTRYKIEMSKLKYLKELKGNNRDMTYHMLCLNKENKINEFLSHFPEYESMWKRILSGITHISKQIFHQYHQKYVKKQTVKFSPQYYPTIIKLHEDYMKSRKPTTPDMVYSLVNSYPSNLLTSLIKSL